MGTRINIEIGCSNGGGAVLFSNSHHPDFDAEKIVQEIVAEECSDFSDVNGLSGIVEKLLSVRYTGHGGHARGERVFVIDIDPGDREKVLSIDYNPESGEIEVTDKTSNNMDDSIQMPLVYNGIELQRELDWSKMDTANTRVKKERG